MKVGFTFTNAANTRLSTVPNSAKLLRFSLSRTLETHELDPFTTSTCIFLIKLTTSDLLKLVSSFDYLQPLELKPLSQTESIC